jgi:multimeric flavodoxin WrbA
MKQFLLINASPRKKGTSAMLASRCREYLESRGHSVTCLELYANLDHLEKIVREAAKADTVLLSGPSYINTYPADVYALLKELYAGREVLHGQKIYGIIQGGMPYSHTHENGLMALELFAKKAGLSYMGGFVMGMGAMLNGQPLEKLLNAKKVIPQLNLFFEHMEKGEESPRQVYLKSLMHMPGLGWRLMARIANRNMDKDLKKHGIDMKKPSPYLSKDGGV